MVAAAQKPSADRPRERREHARVVETDGIAVRVQPERSATSTDSGNTFLRLTRDISRGGLCFTHHEGLAVDTRVRVHLALDMPRKIVTQFGQVRWCERTDEEQPYVIGVRFTEAEPVDRETWLQYVDQLTAQPG